MAKNLNTTPYFEDFDEFKNYHQILFKPEYAVQARELTQLQSILKNQIAKFGNHIFRQGSIVIPGNSFSEMAVPYVRVASTYNGVAVTPSLFEGKVIVGDVSGVKAYVKKVVPATATDPLTFYLSYTSGGMTNDVPNGKLVFDSNELLTIESLPAIGAYVEAATPIGVGTMAYVNDGVYYINGTFVSVQKQSIVISKYTNVPNCHVLLKVIDSIIDSTMDETLLDPAQGSYNFSAPGADRLQTKLELTSLPLGSQITDDYVELMRFENGELIEHFNSPKYSELEKSLAQRTYDESGDYVVQGLNLSIREHRKEGVNGGVYSDGNFDKMIYELSPGKAYISGLAVDNLGTKRIAADKSRTSSHVVQDTGTIKPSWGQYLLIQTPQGTLNIQARETIQLWNVSSISGGSQIGTAKVLGLDYHVGDGSTAPIYKLYVSDLALTSESYDDIGSIRLASNNFSAKVVAEYDAPVTAGTFNHGDVITFNTTDRTATVSFYDSAAGVLYAHKHDAAKSAPKAGDRIIGATADTTILSKTMLGKTGESRLIFPLPNSATKALKDSTNTYDLSFTQWSVLTIPAGSTTVSIASGILVPIEAGTFIALTNSGTDSRSNYTLSGGGTAIVRSSAAPVGGVTIYCQLSRVNAAPRTKTDSTHSGTYTSTSTVMLSHADVYKISSIVSDGIDVTNRYTLNTGQTDFDYGISQIKLKNGFSIPTSDLTVQYQYFMHSTGDFFSVDSYPSGMSNDELPTYRSVASGRTYSMRDCMDFRKTVGFNSNIVVPDTFITTSIQKYVPRIDVLCMDRQGTLILVSGTPSATPKTPTVPSTLYALSKFFVPAFTYNIGSIRQTRLAVKRYTMENLAALEKRILNVEQYSLLSSAEAEATNTPFIDAATGLDRFKTGYLVESMSDPFQVASAFTDGFTASINRKFGIGAKTEDDVIQLNPTSTGIGVVNSLGAGLITQTTPLYVSSTVFNTGGVFTLPYYDKVFASVGVSSKVTNINPFNVIGWSGRLSLSPQSDVWVDVFDRPEIVNNVTETIVNTIYVAVPAPAPEPAPAEIFVPVYVPPQPALAVVDVPTPVVLEQPPTPIYVETPIVVGPAPAPEPDYQDRGMTAAEYGDAYGWGGGGDQSSGESWGGGNNSAGDASNDGPSGDGSDGWA